MAGETSAITRGPMYRCDPYFTIQKIKLPDSMYVLPSPISPLTVRWPDVSITGRYTARAVFEFLLWYVVYALTYSPFVCSVVGIT